VSYDKPLLLVLPSIKFLTNRTEDPSFQHDAMDQKHDLFDFPK